MTPALRACSLLATAAGPLRSRTVLRTRRSHPLPSPLFVRPALGAVSFLLPHAPRAPARPARYHLPFPLLSLRPPR
jgi:hypothetical protein